MAGDLVVESVGMKSDEAWKRAFRFCGALIVAGLAFALGHLAAAHEQQAVVGSFTVIRRPGGLLIAAPHGDADPHTGKMARTLCERTQWSCLVARGFITEGPRVNVNRPTEGVRIHEAAFSSRAAQVYDAYLTEVHRLAPRLRLYVELHGNANEETHHRIEIATAGVSETWARRIRQHLNQALTNAGVGQYSAQIDVLGPVRYAATHNREFGALSMIQPALHIELPEGAREEHRQQIVDALARTLPSIAASAEVPSQFAKAM